ncbi:hypothetical protein HZC35_03405 [Candidatus Saganbacteria bacterium]|nr:hypothetical protein [Candidatus Saganbacteria bacterium]
MTERPLAKRNLPRVGKIPAFSFRVQIDHMTGMHYVEARQGNHYAGHFDFNLEGRWMYVHYGTLKFSSAESLSEWSSCTKGPAIEVAEQSRAHLRGIGSSLVSLALSWGKRKGLLGMKIIQPRTPTFWRKLKFAPDGKDLVFYFATQRILPIRIRPKVS